MSNKNDSLGDRMKRYENISRISLTRRIPVIIRIDGKAFHTFTKGLNKPFDSILMRSMQETMKFLCENIQGCVLGYTQSDEITLVLTDYQTITTDAWFGYGVQKMCSIAASLATVAFNKSFRCNAENYIAEHTAAQESGEYPQTTEEAYKYHKYIATLQKCIEKNALFDARVFSIPKDEVCNCLIWRQQDATRNSIESVGQANFPHRQLQNKTCNMIQEMLWAERNINWNDFPTDCKRGSCSYKKETEIKMPSPENPEEMIIASRRRWVIDREPPIFTQDREYVERWL